jgi:hypothetical protein
MANRQVSIFINGKEVANQIKSITAEKAKLNRELNLMTVGTKEYEDAAKELRKVNGIIAEHTAKIGGVQSSWKSITAGANKFLGVAGIAFGAEQVIQYGKQLYQTGVGMDTLARKANTVLGTSLSYVEAQAEKVAQAMGLTNAEYVAAIANSADLLKPMGFTTEEAAKQSVQIQDLAGALSEWSGGKFNAIETTESLRKALLGEREELERYGVSIKQAELNQELASRGMDKLTGNSLKQAEAMVTLELITRKSADAIRGYSENSDSAIRRQAELEAKVKNISENLATTLLPVFESLAASAGGFVEVIGGVVNFFGDLGGGAKKASESVSLLQAEFNAEVETLKRGNLSQENRVKLIDGINDRYGRYLPNLIQESDSLDSITKKQDAANAAFLQRITLLAAEEKLKEVSKKRIEIFEQELDLQLRLTKAEKSRLENRSADLSSNYLAASSVVIGGDINVDNINKAIEENKKEQADIQNELQKTIDAAAKAGVDVAAALGTKEGGGIGNKVLEFDQKAAEKEREKLEKHLEQLAESVAKFKEEERISNLSENDRRLAEVAAKYQDEIDQAIELEKSKNAAVSAAATEQKVELLKLQSEALEEERAKIAEEELTALLERLTAENEAVLELEQTQREAREEILKEIKEFTDEALLTDAELELQRLEEQGARLLELATSQGEDTTKLKEAIEARKAAIDKKAKEEEKKREEEALKASAAIQDAKLGLLKDLSSGLSELAGQSEAFQKAIFLFQKGVAAAEVIINLQREIATINATYAAAPPVAITLSTIARVRAGISLATIAATGIAGIAKQKKHGGFASIRGEDDGQVYNAMLIGQRPTGLLDYPHPVLMGSGILANEVGKEYYVSHHDLRKPAVLDHVRAIENITSHRQRAGGGFASASPTQNVAAPGAGTDPELKQLMGLVASFLGQLLAKGVQANIGNDEILALKRQIAQLDKASGGRL